MSSSLNNISISAHSTAGCCCIHFSTTPRFSEYALNEHWLALEIACDQNLTFQDYSFEGWLNACTFPDSTPANGSIATLIRAGFLAAKLILQAAASSAALLTVKASPPNASIMASYLQQKQNSAKQC
jgi:hypothetical protein